MCAIPLPDSTQRRLCTNLEQVLLVVCEFIVQRCPVSIRPVAVECGKEMLCLPEVLFLSRVLKLRKSLAEEECKLQAALLMLASFEYECGFTLDTLPTNCITTLILLALPAFPAEPQNGQFIFTRPCPEICENS